MGAQAVQPSTKKNAAIEEQHECLVLSRISMRRPTELKISSRVRIVIKGCVIKWLFDSKALAFFGTFPDHLAFVT